MTENSDEYVFGCCVTNKLFVMGDVSVYATVVLVGIDEVVVVF